MNRSRRSVELRKNLADQFGIDEATAGNGVKALIGAIQDRLPASLEVSLVSWVPEAWGLLVGAETVTGARGVAAIAERLECAGIPRTHIVAFIAAIVGFLEQRMGTPLATALRRRIPELASFEEQAAADPSAANGERTPPAPLVGCP
ncbi:MAG: hypothetical protein JSV80_15480 [Acidobacteriota bacterium]|nr:MAG: hypothetical protein JSV80_15480 [Acidobacteriota bacterium]